MFNKTVVYDAGLTGTGLIAVNKEEKNITESDWQLTGLDLSPYKALKFYIKGDADSTSVVSRTQMATSMIFEVSLDPRSRASNSVSGAYIGGYTTICPNDRNVQMNASVLISEDKTKIMFLSITSVYGTTTSARNSDARALFRIEGLYE